MNQASRKSDFKRLLPMPALQENVEVNVLYSPSDFKRIAYGYYSWSMDMKWDIYLDGDQMYMHRSWTGRCIYIVEFDSHPEGHMATNMTINRDPEQLKIQPIADSIKTALWVIQALLIEDRSKRLPEDWED